MRVFPLGILLTVALLMCGPSTAVAFPIEFLFTATVSSVEKPVFPTVNPGDPVFGKIIFESTTPDAEPLDTEGLYLFPGSMAVRVGPIEINRPLAYIDVLRRPFSGHRYQVSTIPTDGDFLIQINLERRSFDPPFFDDDSLPLVPPPLEAFPHSWLFTVYSDVSPGPGVEFVSKISGELDSLRVPVPPVLLLLGLSLGCLIGLRTAPRSWQR